MSPVVPWMEKTDSHSTAANPVRNGSCATIAIMLPTWVGDSCMVTPALRAIRNRFPNSKIIGIGRPVIRELLSGLAIGSQSYFDEFLMTAKKKGKGVHSRLGLTKSLRSQKIDLAVLFTNSFWSAAAMRLAGSKRVIGYDRDARGWLLTDRLPVPRQNKIYIPIPAVDYYLQIAAQLGCDVRDRTMSLALDTDDRNRLDQLWQSINFDHQMPTLVINSNAATRKERVWSTSKVRELAWRVATELGWQVLIHCGPSEQEGANKVAFDLAHSKIASMGVMRELPIGLTKAVMSHADVVVSTDSGPRHVAVAMNKPVVSLYGPTDPAWTTTYNFPETYLKAPREGNPQLSTSIDEISASGVFEVVSRVVSQLSKQNRAA